MGIRSLTTCPIFGKYMRVKENVLPIYEDVMECFSKRFILALKEKSKKKIPSAKIELKCQIERFEIRNLFTVLPKLEMFI